MTSTRLQEDVRVDENGPRLVISWPAKYRLIGIAILAVPILSVVGLLGGEPGKPSHDWTSTTTAVVVAMFLLAAYPALAYLTNRHVMVIDSGTLTLRQRPFPWGKTRRLQVDEIEQVFSKRTKHKGRTEYEHFTTVHYHLMAKSKSGRTLRLVPDLKDKEVVLALEEVLEHHLRIEDRPVKGEVHHERDET